MNKLIALDVETTGIDPINNSLVSIGAVEIDNPTNTFYGECRVWDGAVVTPEALKVNGFSMAQVHDATKKTEAELVKEFFSWVGGPAIIIAHNSAFDKGFIAEAAKRAGTMNPLSFRTIDIHSIVYMHMLRKGDNIPHSLSLNACLKYFNQPKEPDPHNALTGALCNVTLFNKVRNYDGSEQEELFPG